MSAEFSGGYRSIRGQSGGNEDDRGSFGPHQYEDFVIFQSLSDSISSNIFQINSNVQALERICTQLGNQLKEVPYDKLHRIQQGTNELANDTNFCLKRMINLLVFSATSAPLFNFTGSAGSSVKTTLPSSESSQPSFNFDGAVNGPTSINGPSVTAGQTGNALLSFTGTQQSSTAPVVENQNSMGGEDTNADSNNNHDQTTFPQATGGFNFAAQATGPSAPTFNFGGSSVGSKRGVNVAGPTNDQPSMFNIGAGQTSTPSNRVYRKAVRRKR